MMSQIDCDGFQGIRQKIVDALNAKDRQITELTSHTAALVGVCEMIKATYLKEGIHATFSRDLYLTLLQALAAYRAWRESDTHDANML